jgi:endo-1,4-beta-xylanase
MQFRSVTSVLSVLLLPAAFVQYSIAQTTTTKTISSNQTGKNGNYFFEYWKDNGTGTMTLKDGCNFSCTWGSVGNILFRQGVRPGSRKQIVTYTADYKPTGNSYLSVYGWFKNPLVEYYIIESWGSWKPPGSAASKGTITTDSGTYDIYQNQRTGPSIEGNGTFQQYWSVRKTKHTSGVITCANHFNAWESKGMKIGSMYEVSFNVEAYQSSGGSADVTVSMDTGIGITRTSNCDRLTQVRGTNGLGRIIAAVGNTQTFKFTIPINSFISLKTYNVLGQEIAGTVGKDYCAGQHSVTFVFPNLAGGILLFDKGR